MQSRVKAAKQAALLVFLALVSSLIAYSMSSQLAPSQIRTKTITVTKSIAVTEQASQTEDEYRNAAEALLNKVMRWVEQERGLKFRENVSLEVLTKEWVIEHWGAGFLNLTEVRVEETILKAFFMVPSSFNITKFKIGTSGYTVAASAGNTIYVVREYFDPYDELRAGSTLAHELTHVLQGEYFDLPKPRTSDEKNAQLALIEGDANLVGYLYFKSHGGEARAKIRESSLDPLDALWFFPYMYGESFVRYVYARGWWNKVNALYEDPPTSTTEILHPEKYLSGWKPVKVEFSESVDSNWTLMLRDTLGEFFIRQMLRTHLSQQEANRSAEGWRGDILELYERAGDTLLRWKIVWDSEQDASEFFFSFTKILEKVGAVKILENTWKVDHKVVEVTMAKNQVKIIITVSEK